MRYLMFICLFMIACGDVESMLAPDGGGGAGNETAAGAGGSAPGAGGAPGGAMGSAGSDASPGRPLGAGCTTDDQCGSGVCDGETRACCSGRADSCNTCVGGYLVALPDNTACDGNGNMCPSKSVRTFHGCRAGACTAITMDCAGPNMCVTNSKGTFACKPNTGVCDGQDGCLCDTEGGSGAARPCS